MICRKELREQLIKRIIELYKQAKTVSIDDKICVTLLLDAEDAWEHKKDVQVVFSANAIKDYSGFGNLMVDLSVWKYYNHMEDAGACLLNQLSTDSLYDLIDYYKKRL